MAMATLFGWASSSPSCLFPNPDPFGTCQTSCVCQIRWLPIARFKQSSSLLPSPNPVHLQCSNLLQQRHKISIQQRYCNRKVFDGFRLGGCVGGWPLSSGRRIQEKRNARTPSRKTQASYGGLVDDPFEDEAIGAEHGEGFSTFRPSGPLHIDVEFLNDRMRKRGLDRIRLAMRPDEAFGLIYSWDNVLADTRSLRWSAWKRLASIHGFPMPETPSVQKQLNRLPASKSISMVLGWTTKEYEIDSLIAQLAELYCLELAKVKAPMAGVREWLQALARAGVPCAVASSLDRLTLLSALERMRLRQFFSAFVTAEDGMESIAHRFLSAAVKLDRPPSKCVVFEDDPRGITAAHNCSMKAVALIGTHPAYELKQAEMAVTRLSDLSVINLRRMFANRGLEFMDLLKQTEDKLPPRRRIRTDTIF